MVQTGSVVLIEEASVMPITECPVASVNKSMPANEERLQGQYCALSTPYLLPLILLINAISFVSIQPLRPA